jgi:hypothetical protein
MSSTQSDSSHSSTHDTPSFTGQLPAIERVVRIFELIVKLLQLSAQLESKAVIENCLFRVLYIPYINATLAFLATNRHVPAIPGLDQIEIQVHNRYQDVLRQVSEPSRSGSSSMDEDTPRPAPSSEPQTASSPAPSLVPDPDLALAPINPEACQHENYLRELVHDNYSMLPWDDSDDSVTSGIPEPRYI